MKFVHDIIIRPIITEDSMAMVPDKKYVFEVAKNATKPEIAKAVAEVFKVDVKSVNTMNVYGKLRRRGASPEGRTASWKKAIVTLSKDSKGIEFFETMV